MESHGDISASRAENDSFVGDIHSHSIAWCAVLNNWAADWHNKLKAHVVHLHPMQFSNRFSGGVIFLCQLSISKSYDNKILADVVDTHLLFHAFRLVLIFVVMIAQGVQTWPDGGRV